MSALISVEQHYSTGLTRPNIERALIGAGKDPAALEPADLAMLETSTPWAASRPPRSRISRA